MVSLLFFMFIITYISCFLRRSVMAENDILLTEEFVKGGCPSHLRGRLWKQILQSHVGDKVCTLLWVRKKKEKESLRRRTHSWHVLFIFFLSKEKTYFQAKRLAVIQTEYLTDKIIIKVRKQGYFYSFLTSKFPGILLPVPVRVQILELLTPSVHYYIEHGYGRLIRRKWDSGTRIIAACKVKRGLGGVA